MSGPRWLLGVLSLLVLPLTAGAQSVPNRVDVLVIPAVGDALTVAPVKNLIVSIPLSGASVLCGRPVTTAEVPPLVNPTLVEIDDPFTADRSCVVPLPDRFTIPPGSYRVVTVFISAKCAIGGQAAVDCRGARSLVGVPGVFEILPEGPPAAPTNVKVKR